MLLRRLEIMGGGGGGTPRIGDITVLLIRAFLHCYLYAECVCFDCYLQLNQVNPFLRDSTILPGVVANLKERE